MCWEVPCAKVASPSLGPRTLQRLGVECGSWGLVGVGGVPGVITWAGQTRRQADSAKRMMQEGVGEGRDRCWDLGQKECGGRAGGVRSVRSGHGCAPPKRTGPR